MRVAVIGAGAAGLTSAWLLQDDHEVVVFEGSDRPGGHARTIRVEDGANEIYAEVGAQFFFEEGYPGLSALIERLGLSPIRERIAASMTMADGRTIVVPPLRARALTTCLSTRTMRELFWLQRFLTAGEELVRQADWSVTIERLVDRVAVPRDVAEGLVVPLIASSWGVPRDLARTLSAFSVRCVMGLHASRLPHSLRLERGLSSYVDRLVADSPRSTLHLNAAVQRVEHTDGELRVHTKNGSTSVDAVILACDWHNSATMCEGAPRLTRWARAFRAFEDYEVRIALHRDPSLMPRRREHWEATNFSFTRDERPRTTVWAGKPTASPVFRSWLRPGEPEPAGTTHVARFRHVAVTPEHPARQAEIARLQGDAGMYAVGMYTHGVDNHESALRSALSVAQKLAPDARRVRWFSSRVSA